MTQIDTVCVNAGRVTPSFRGNSLFRSGVGGPRHPANAVGPHPVSPTRAVPARLPSGPGPAQAIDQAVEFVQRAELDGHFPHFLDPPRALDALFHPDLHLRGELVG